MINPIIKRIVKKLGEDVRVARLRRRWSQKDLAVKTGVSVGTVQRVEAGDPGVGIGTIVTMFYMFGCQQQIEDALDPTRDELGLSADFFHLPMRIRSARRITSRSVDSVDENGVPEDVVSF